MFCYICGSLTLKSRRQNITTFVKKAYFAYFGVKLGDQDKAFAPHYVCHSCVAGLRKWTLGKQKSLPFGVPMVWREQVNHVDDCYFCMVKVDGHNKKSMKSIVYPNLKSAIRPVPHSPEIPVPTPPVTLESSSSSSDSTYNDDEFAASTEDEKPDLFTQEELNDLVRDLGLSKESAQILGSRLKEKRLLVPGTTFYWYRRREEEFLEYFTEDGPLVYCNNIEGLLSQYGVKYNAKEWRLFIDATKRNLKAVLLNNGNKYASIPVAYSVHLKENYENLEILLAAIKYSQHQWVVCGDLKIIGMLLGLQSGFTKFPCFLCLWDSRARDLHWDRKEWPVRTTMEPGHNNVTKKCLIRRENIILPPLHIKLGIMKQFVKALNKEGECFKYISSKFSFLSEAKITEGIFVGPQIRKLMKDETFENLMTNEERLAWTGFRNVIAGFLGNRKQPDYRNIVENMLMAMKQLGCNMSVKLHFLHSHIDFFPENLGDFSEEHGERFHQDMKEIEKRYQGRWDRVMMADYCWCLKRDNEKSGHKRKSRISHFRSKRKRV